MWLCWKPAEILCWPKGRAEVSCVAIPGNGDSCGTLRRRRIRSRG